MNNKLSCFEGNIINISSVISGWFNEYISPITFLKYRPALAKFGPILLVSVNLIIQF